MISPEKVEEWLREVSERPDSAALIIQYISNRLRDLTERNEALQVDNLALMTGKKVENYENRIAQLEYQVELLKRQLQGSGNQTTSEISLLLFRRDGRILRRRLNVLEDLASGTFLGRIDMEENPEVRLLAAAQNEDLLVVFSSGRSLRIPLDELPEADEKQLTWQQAYLVEPRGVERLTAILPVGRMALFDCCVQTSRRGYVKKISRQFFEGYIAKENLGSGVRAQGDENFQATLANNQDQLVLISKDGELAAASVERLPVAIEEINKLQPGDHLVAVFRLSAGQEIALVTADGTAFRYTPTWGSETSLEKPQKRSLFSKLKRASGVQVAGAGAAGKDERGVVLWSDGTLAAVGLDNLTSSGSLLAPPANQSGGAQPNKPGLLGLAILPISSG